MLTIQTVFPHLTPVHHCRVPKSHRFYCSPHTAAYKRQRVLAARLHTARARVICSFFFLRVCLFPSAFRARAREREMAGRGHAALWVKLYELELQLRLMRAARGEEGAAAAADDDDEVGDVASRAGAEGGAAAGSTMPTCAAATPGATRRVASPRRRRSGRRPGRGAALERRRRRRR